MSSWELRHQDFVCGLPDSSTLAPLDCTIIGDLSCYSFCHHSGDCTDPRFPYCRTLGLFHGTDYCCNGVGVKVCRDVDQNDLPVETEDRHLLWRREFDPAFATPR